MKLLKIWITRLKVNENRRIIIISNDNIKVKNEFAIYR